MAQRWQPRELMNAQHARAISQRLRHIFDAEAAARVLVVGTLALSHADIDMLADCDYFVLLLRYAMSPMRSNPNPKP